MAGVLNESMWGINISIERSLRTKGQLSGTASMVSAEVCEAGAWL